jgi:hypothetical protein
MFNISPTHISTIYFWSKIILFIGAGATFFGTIGTIWSGTKLENIFNVQLSENKKETAKANKKTAELQNESLGMKVQLEKERTKRLELEQAVAPRIMEQQHSSTALKQLKNVSAIISSINDIESKRTAGQINATLQMAGWRTKIVPYDPKEIYQDGVVVERNVGRLPKDDNSGKAADELVNQLKKSKIESHRMPARKLPKNTIFVKVGFKPYVYFSDKMVEKGEIDISGNIVY